MRTLREILTDIRPEFDFSSSDDFIRDGMLDSFDMIALVSELDKTYGISIAGIDIVADNFRNIGTIQRLLDRYVAAS